MKTVQEYQNFLVKFFTNTPGLVSGIYNPQDALIAENWVQGAKYPRGLTTMKVHHLIKIK